VGLGSETTWLVLGAGTALGSFLTALTLLRHERGQRHALEEAATRLRQSEGRLQALVRNSSDMIAVIDVRGMFTYVSPAAERLFGRPVDELLGGSPFPFIHPDDRDAVIATFTQAQDRPGEGDPVEFRVQLGDGTWRMLEAVANNLLDDPAIAGLVVNARDATERHRAERELRDAQERFRSAFEHAPIGMALSAIDGRFFRVNRALARMLGRAEDELLGASMLGLTHPDDRPQLVEATDRLLAGDVGTYQVEMRYLHVDGRAVWVGVSVSLVRDVAGQPLYMVSQAEDITERKASGERLAHQAIHDPLTGLPNRLLFVDRLRRALNDVDPQLHGGVGPPPGRVAVLFLDLDHFKVVNDSLGHSAGDRLLVAVADRLRAAIRPDDTVARFGGDEFTVLCTGVPDETTARELAERVAAAVCRPVQLVEGEVFVTASVGIALSGGELETPETLLRNADSAMYGAKDHGRSRTELFDTGSHDRAITTLRTGNELHRALERSELRLHYQPIVSLETGRITGFEALMRWEHPERGMVRPDEFIPLAEETGLIVPMGRWALQEACRQVAWWHSRGAPLTMSVNLSPRQLTESTLTDDFAEILRRSKVDPNAIWLEITESTLMRDAESAVTTLGKLRSLGVHLSVDDFGTGYSSMTYLKRFPVEALKVDRSFVDGLGEESGDTAICTAVVSLAHALGLRAVAEGVETAGQVAELRQLGCEMAQGYLFGRPEPAATYGEHPEAKQWAGLAVG
jgi:diguanylate cyclase (GGDEF)-like protein/PAS domain S-box-containing protein